MSYVLYHNRTHDCLGKASDIDQLGDLIRDLYFDDGIFSHEIDVYTVTDNGECEVVEVSE